MVENVLVDRPIISFTRNIYFSKAFRESTEGAWHIAKGLTIQWMQETVLLIHNETEKADVEV
jgi:hypothetical protein